MELAVSGSTPKFSVTATKKARVSTTLQLPEDPMRLRNVEFLVLEEDMPNVLLSRPILLSLGFNLNAHLARVRAKLHDQDFSHIVFVADEQMMAENTPQPQGKLSKLLQNSAEETDENPQFLDSSPKNNDHPTVDKQEPTLEDGAIAGNHDENEVLPELERIFAEAKESGLPKNLHKKLKSLLNKYRDIFRVRLGSDRAVSVPPMNIQLQTGASPVRVIPRKYSKEQLDFLNKKVKELEELGLIFRNTASSWASAPLVVPKKGPEKWRLTVDLRLVNKVTVPHAWPMPHIEEVTASLAGKKCFASIDLCQGYWQSPLSKESQACQSFITHTAVYTPTRVLQGQRNATSFCQSTVQHIFMDIIRSLLLWLDDVVFHAVSPPELLKILRIAFLFVLSSV